MSARERALELAEAAWRAASGDEAQAIVHGERSGLARFAASSLSQPTLVENETVTIRVVRDGRVGTATTNVTGPGGIAAAARRAEEAADAAPPDPGFPGLQPAAPAPEVEGFDEETAELSPALQAEGAREAIEAVSDLGLYGFFTSAHVWLAVASSTGQAVAQSMTDASVLAIAADEARSGYAASSAWRARELSPGDVARRAAEVARRTAGATSIEPGTYRALLLPDALASLLQEFAFSSVSGRALLDGRSYLADRIGEQALHPSFTLVDDGRDPAGLPKAFDFEGVPKEPVAIVERGVLAGVVWDRRTAAEAGGGRASTGHALMPADQAWSPQALNLVVAPGDASLEELAGLVGEGLLVTRLHYLSVVDAREGIITGMTRDGTFRIESGRVAGPLANLRFTTSFPALARDLLGLSREAERVTSSDFYGVRYPVACVVPALATASFQVTGTGGGPGL